MPNGIAKTPAQVSRGGLPSGRRLPSRNAGVTRRRLINEWIAGPTCQFAQ
jgi:hypothetical protein